MKFNLKFSHYIFSLFFVLISVKTSSQVTYSIEALTGKGDLRFVGDENKLQPEVYYAFIEMQKAALKDGISIEIVSAYRSFDRQNKIWNRKYEAYTLEGIPPKKAIEKIIEYSTLPGTSRHHWGTDIDIVDGSKIQPVDVLSTSHYESKGVFFNLKKWMDKNSQKFGFYLVYTNKKNRKGFKYEPWHYSYKKISRPMLMQFMSINFSSFINSCNLEGFKYVSPQFIEKYTKENILDINPQLK
jgi:LAS superfamily LD-carboxypeptidase LdcB